MLQRNDSESAVYYSGSVSPQEGGFGESIDFVLGFLRRQYMIILSFTLVAVGVGAVYLSVPPPTYTARAKLIIGTQRAQFVQQQSIFTDGPIDSSQLESQLQILQSKDLASSVLEKLGLIGDPEFPAPATGSRTGPLKTFVLSALEKLD